MGDKPSVEVPGTRTTQDTTVADLLEQISRLVANDPHARCHVGEGPLAPVAAALNHLAVQLAAGRTKSSEAFGIQALVEQSPNIMLTCDRESRIRFLNFTTPGITVSDTIGMSVYNTMAPHEHERVRAIVQRVLETGEPAGYEIHSIYRPGPEWFAVRVGAVRAGAEIVGFTMILTDISDLKRAQLQLEQSNQELESFASVTSHDLQEPLRKIQTYGERLKARCAAALGSEGLDYLERMLGASSRMRRLIEDLLSYSRVSSISRPFSRVALSEIAREVLGDLETVIEKEGATVTLGELPTLEAEPTQMRQLLQNLLSNALKFRREDVPPSISVHGTVDEAAQRCELVVRDNGIGFDEKYTERIFNAFQRLHGRGSKYEGSGVGLATCRKIVERHGGNIVARSAPGEGATFTVTLPLSRNTSN